MTLEQYIKHPALSFSTLKNVALCGAWNKFQKEQEGKDVWELGHMFELYLEKAIGNKKPFRNKYFLTYSQSKIVKKYYDRIEDMTLFDISDLHYNINKLGDIRYTIEGVIYKNEIDKYNIINDMFINFPQYPIRRKQIYDIKQMVNNMLELEIHIFGEPFPIAELLMSPKAQFQVVLTWEKDGVKKKALIDFMTVIKIDGVKYIIIIDFKTTGNIFGWRWDLKNVYKYQCRHFIEGVKECYPDMPVYPVMPFACVMNKEPFLVQENVLEYDPMYLDNADIEYNTEVRKWVNWIENGKDESPVLESNTVKVYL